MNNNTTTIYNTTIVRETEKAICINTLIETLGNIERQLRKDLWIPKSQVASYDSKNSAIEVNSWFVDKMCGLEFKVNPNILVIA